MAQNQPPNGCNIVQPDPAARDLVEKRLECALEKWWVSGESREWPGYEPRIAYVSTPSWIEYAWETRILRDQIENDEIFLGFTKRF